MLYNMFEEEMQLLVSFFYTENKYLEEKVSNRGIDIICNRLGNKGYQLAIELGLTPEEIERIQMDFRTSIDRNREYINKWRQNESKRTYKVLLQALATVEVDNVLDILSLIYQGFFYMFSFFYVTRGMKISKGCCSWIEIMVAVVHEI